MFRLYKERLSQVDIKLQEVMAGCAQEYLEPLANLQENMQIRTKVAGESNKHEYLIIGLNVPDFVDRDRNYGIKTWFFRS